MSHSMLSNWTQNIFIWAWLSSPSSYLPPSSPGGILWWGMCWAVWGKDWTVLTAQLGTEVWTSPWSVLPHFYLLLLWLSLIHPEKPERTFPIRCEGWLARQMGKHLYMVQRDTCSWRTAPHATLSKDFLEHLLWEPSSPTPTPTCSLIHYFKKSICEPMAYRALGTMLEAWA